MRLFAQLKQDHNDQLLLLALWNLGASVFQLKAYSHVWKLHFFFGRLYIHGFYLCIGCHFNLSFFLSASLNRVKFLCGLLFHMIASAK